jgi:hypothetical protein
MVHKFVSSNTPRRYASAASCNAKTAVLWNLTSFFYLFHDLANQALERGLANEKIS